MKKYRYANILSLVLFCFFFSQGNAQDSLTILNGDTIAVINILNGAQTHFLPSNPHNLELEKVESLTDNIGTVLENKTSIFFKNYGAGQLSTISYRGLNAAQINVEWNGLQLNSPMLGQVDFSVIPSMSAKNIELADAADNLGGTIKISSHQVLLPRTELTLLSEVGSFGTYNNTFQFVKASYRFSSETAVQYKRAKNNYSYTNFALPNKPELDLVNAETNQLGLVQNFAVKLNNSDLRINYLGSINNRNLPPTKFETFSSENQKDQIHAIGSVWEKRTLNAWNLKIENGFVFNRIDFKLSENSSPEISKAGTIQNSFSVRNYFSKPRISIGVEVKHRYEYGIINAYETVQNRHIAEVIGRFGFHISENHGVTFGLNQMVLSTGNYNFLPAVEYSFLKNALPANLNFKLNYAQKVRYPTLNDLYWSPGGNENLEPENAHNFDATFIIDNRNKNTLFYEFSVVWFNILASNYIQWQPTNFGYWSPKNIGEVYSRGYEVSLNLSKSFEKVKINSSGKYAYNRSTNRESNQQLAYVPFHNINWNSSLSWKAIQFNYLQQFTSPILASDNKLANFYLVDLSMSNTFNFKRSQSSFVLKFSVENLLNKEFETVINRPMPGRYFEGSILFNLNLKNK